jgi:recombination protein RecA
MGRTKGSKNKITKGSGNVFKDIGCKEPEKKLAEAEEKIKKAEVRETKEEIVYEKKEKLLKVMKEINKEFKNPSMVKFANEEPPKESLPFGVTPLDEFAGGGAVVGNFVIFYGGEGVGKTTLAITQIAEAQKKGKVCAYIDLEHTLDVSRMKDFGVDPEQLALIEDCTTAEQAMDIVIKLAKEKAVDLIIIDSIQAMSPSEEQFEGKAEKERSMKQSEMALLARKMGKFLRRTAPFIYQGKVGVILIGQVRTEGIGSFITKEGLTGGHAVKHWSMLTIYMRKGQGADAPTTKIELDEKDEKGKPKFDEIKIGFDCVLKIEKTKKSNSKPELSDLHIPFYFNTGFVKTKESEIF